jgi:hypothetical protein
LLNTDLLAYVLRLLRLACKVETITAYDGNLSPTRDNQIDAAFMALLIRYAEGNRGGPKQFPSATVPPNFHSADFFSQLIVERARTNLLPTNLRPAR